MCASALGSCAGLCVKVGLGHAYHACVEHQSANTMLAYIIDANTEEASSMPSCRRSGFNLRDAKAGLQLEVVRVIGHAQFLQACHALFGNHAGNG
jgi:hypothetical protein